MVVQLIIFPSIFNLNGMHHGAASVIKNADNMHTKIQTRFYYSFSMRITGCFMSV